MIQLNLNLKRERAHECLQCTSVIIERVIKFAVGFQRNRMFWTKVHQQLFKKCAYIALNKKIVIWVNRKKNC